MRFTLSRPRRKTTAPACICRSSAIALALVALLLPACKREPAIVVARVTEPVVTAAPAIPPRARILVAPDRVNDPNGRPPGAALPFRGAVDVPGHLVFVLVIGSDARPGENVRRARADSIHVVAVDPSRRIGTLVGIPRDAWVTIPGHGNGKINSALQLGGPPLAVETVRRLTGLPVSYYVLTGFAGMVSMVDELGGVDVHVERRMNDKASGARFAPGWHHFNGDQALAYTRNRHDVENGDFTRSEHQGDVIVAALRKLRAEVADEGGIRTWLSVLGRHCELDMSAGDAYQLGTLGRTVDPDGLGNVVAPGRVGTAGGGSVVFLDDNSYRLFRDVGADAVADGRSDSVTPVPSVTPHATVAPTATPAWTAGASPTPQRRATPAPTPSPTPKPLLP